MRQHLENMSQEARNPKDLQALDERVRSYTHLASRNQYLVLIISLTWAALYQAITTNSGRFLLAVAFAISTSILSLFICRLWLAGLKPMDERAKRLMLSSFTWTSFYVLMFTYAILLYLHLYVGSSDFLVRSEPFPYSYLYLSCFLSIATRSATFLVNHIEPAGTYWEPTGATYWLFWCNVISIIFISLMDLSTLSNKAPIFVMLDPVLGFLLGAVLLALIVTRHNRTKPRAEDE